MRMAAEENSSKHVSFLILKISACIPTYACILSVLTWVTDSNFRGFIVVSPHRQWEERPYTKQHFSVTNMAWSSGHSSSTYLSGVPRVHRVLAHPYRMPPYKAHHTVGYEVEAGAFSILVVPVQLTVHFFLDTIKNLSAASWMLKIGVVYRANVGGVKFSHALRTQFKILHPFTKSSSYATAPYWSTTWIR